jgi:hypothetical protein
MGPLEVFGLILLFVLPAVVGYRLGLKRRHEVMGLVLGLVLSWLGVLIVALLPKPAATTIP